MDKLKQFVDIFLHLDKHLNEWAGSMGSGLYVLLFAIIFCETGLVVMPFLPGDSLLFAVGALSASEGSPINIVLVTLLMFVAGVLGDAVNYSIGKRIGPGGCRCRRWKTRPKATVRCGSRWCVGAATAIGASCSSRSAWAARLRASWPNGWHGCWWSAVNARMR